MRLVSDWRDAWKWLSVHALAMQAAAVTTWATVPADLRAAVPAGMLAGVCGAIGALGFLGRILDQSPKPDETDQAGA